jgi:predicted nucleic acid-binding protein
MLLVLDTNVLLSALVSSSSSPPAQLLVLVAGDKQLLSLRRHKSTRIITPATLVELLR